MRFFWMLFALCCGFSTLAEAQLQPHILRFGQGQAISLNLDRNFTIDVAASGLRRVRFLAQSPDGRIFATGMWNLADNTQGSVFILDGWNAEARHFTHVTHFLDHLRNPNNLAFWTDPATHQAWLYLPLTDRLVRFPYKAGDLHPSGAAQTLIRFPDYGLNYKYGGWHLTRTVALANLHGETKLYVAAGSSCDYCREREVIRASVTEMNPDGSGQRIAAHGLRNAVDLRFLPGLDGGALFATNMGDDHLGTTSPEDTFFELDSNASPGAITHPNANFGWPTCFFTHGRATLDTTPLPEMPPPGDTEKQAARPAEAADSTYGAQPGVYKQGTLLPAGGSQSAPDSNAALGKVPEPLKDCSQVPPAYTTFAAHSSPLGMAYFDGANPQLHDSFLIALHGASNLRTATGYKLVRLSSRDRRQTDFITGFLTPNVTGRAVVHGRPCGLLQVGPDSFLLTDDKLGLVYFIHPAAGSSRAG